MHLRNFSIAEDNIALEYQGLYLDLHNNYSFTSINYDVLKRHITLSWLKRDAPGVGMNDPKVIKLNFFDVSIFKVQERDSEYPFREDDCLSSIGFIHNDFMDDLESFSGHVASDTANHINLCFESGVALKIVCKETMFFQEP